MPDEKTPIDQALDLFVFAPLGLALTARDQLPEMIEKGRTRVEGQMTMAKFIGQFAVQQGKVELEKRLRPYTDSGPKPSGAEPASARGPDPVVSEPIDVAAAPDAPLAPPMSPNGTGPRADALAIHGYDSLSASQVVQRLAGLSAEELEDVRGYESATRARKTVLSKISQLQA